MRVQYYYIDCIIIITIKVFLRYVLRNDLSEGGHRSYNNRFRPSTY